LDVIRITLFALFCIVALNSGSSGTLALVGRHGYMSANFPKPGA
jgi:hypothetical protein